ncbi:ribosome maturation factor RimM [Alkalihalobacillus trypoxylicola]|uniref:Ribosome maturation factor RimM n=1 Tax=Alkalihalobacillus trypoxylicola TaxID=519424 RepID=A0A162F9N9_9BACI|nr:ribosome maturation factor RimM [Alkalihalobacillus trypoxylicola]KYG35105.1 ribosome maturation factor RimM [Alkalihalobacillus trypoxylicola]
MNEWYRVGKVVNTHGIKGEVRVIATTDFEEQRFAIGQELMLTDPNTKKEIIVKIATSRKHKNFTLLSFENLQNINYVEKYKGQSLYVSSEYLEDLEDNEFYYHEILGCQVLTEEGEVLGKIKDILSTGANDVWIVQRKEKGRDILIPYIEQVVKEINVENKTIIIHVMEGLLE